MTTEESEAREMCPVTAKSQTHALLPRVIPLRPEGALYSRFGMGQSPTPESVRTSSAVCSEMLFSRQTSRMFPVCSASFKTPMIRSSANRFRLISSPISQEG